MIIIGRIKFVSRENIRIMYSLRKSPVDRHIVNELSNKLVYDHYKNLLAAQTDHNTALCAVLLKLDLAGIFQVEGIQALSSPFGKDPGVFS